MWSTQITFQMQEMKSSNEYVAEKLVKFIKIEGREDVVGGPLADGKKWENRASDGGELVKEENSEKCYGLAPLKPFIRATCNQKPWVPCRRV